MKIVLSQHAHEKLRAYVDNCPYEIGGLGQVTTDGVNFYVSDLEIFTQKVTASHVDLSADTLAQFQLEKARAKQSLVNYKFWWHSHAKMGVFWSQTDTDTMDSSTEFPWLVSLVTNHKGELKARVDIYKPVHIHIDNVTIEIVRTVNQALIDDCIAEIAEKVTYPVVAPVKPYQPREYSLPAPRYGYQVPQSDKKTTLDDSDIFELRAEALTNKLCDMELEHEELAGQTQTKRVKAKMARLTQDMDRIVEQLEAMGK